MDEECTLRILYSLDKEIILALHFLQKNLVTLESQIVGLHCDFGGIAHGHGLDKYCVSDRRWTVNFGRRIYGWPQQSLYLYV